VAGRLKGHWVRGWEYWTTEVDIALLASRKLGKFDGSRFLVPVIHGFVPLQAVALAVRLVVDANRPLANVPGLASERPCSREVHVTEGATCCEVVRLANTN
jgi:hypothetical protein